MIKVPKIPKVQAAVPAYRVTDRRSSSGYINSYGGSNGLIEAASRTADRRLIGTQDRDFHRNITARGRRTLMDIGRWMFWNIDTLRASILEQADLAVSTFLPQYVGANAAWGGMAEDWLGEWHKIMDIAGPPFDYESFTAGLILSQLVDGDEGILLTGTPVGSDETGYPMIQRIPAHRIWSVTDIVQGGPFDGATIIDGVIVNDYGRAIGYRVNDDRSQITPNSEIGYIDISAQNMFIVFEPLFPGQLRGLSRAALSSFTWQDSAEFDRFEMLAQKAFSAHTLIEDNETGDLDPAKALVAGTNEATFDSSGNKQTMDEQVLHGGIYRYFKAGTNSKLTAFAWDRPSQNAQNFQNRKIRDAFRGTEWDSFFSLDPQAVGGAPMRVIVEKINRVLGKHRRRVAKACARVDGYAISKSIKMEDLAEDPDWYKWEYQGPGDVTADAKYDSDVALQEINQGLSTRKKECAKRGDYWEDDDAQREKETRSDLARATRLAKEFPEFTPQEILVALRPPTKTQQLPSGAPGLVEDQAGGQQP